MLRCASLDVMSNIWGMLVRLLLKHLISLVWLEEM